MVIAGALVPPYPAQAEEKMQACPEMGEGFMRVPGSQTCVKIKSGVKMDAYGGHGFSSTAPTFNDPTPPPSGSGTSGTLKSDAKTADGKTADGKAADGKTLKGTRAGTAATIGATSNSGPTGIDPWKQAR